jgi:DNA-binding transcriptional ArsR family regulator
MKTDYLESLPPHWEDAARIFEALGSPIRQKILLVFDADEALNIKQIAELFPFSRTTTIFHLNVLEQAGLLSRRSIGREVFYQLNKEPLIDALARVLKYAQEEV